MSPLFEPPLTPAQQQALDGRTAIIAGSYLVADLKTALPPAGQSGRFAWVSDLGGGAGYVVSDGLYWKRVSRGIPISLSATTQTVDPLRTGTLLSLSAGIIGSAVQISVATDNIYPGCELTIVNPGTLAVGLGSLGVGIAGTPANAFVPLLGQKWADYVVEGTGKLIIVRTGGLAG